MAAAKKKVSKKTSASLPPAADIPAGFEQIGSGYAPTWKPEEGQALQGKITGAVKTVELKQGRKTVDRRAMEVTEDNTGSRFTVWESAALGEFFDEADKRGEGASVFIRFDRYGEAKKAGQNPPKLFTTAMA